MTACLHGMVSFFHDIVGFLNGRRIPYALSGGMAMNYYVLGRSTKDFDFVVHVHKGQAQEIAAHFATGHYCDEEALADAIQRRSMFNIIEHATGFKADFFVLNDDPFEREKFARRIPVKFFDAEVFIITAEDRLLSEPLWIRQMQSGRQLEDISMIAAYPSLDWTYIHRWIQTLRFLTIGLTFPA